MELGINLKNTRTRNYLLGLLTGYTVTIAGIAISLWLTPFVLRYLDREAYGIFALGSDAITWLALLDIGISSGLNVHLARRSGQLNVQDVSRFASSTFFAQIVLALLMLLIGFVIALGFPSFFDVPEELRRDSVFLMSLLVIGAALSLGVRTFSVILIAHQQIHIDNLIRLGLLVIRTVMIVILLQQGLGLVSLGVASLFAVAITSTFAVLRAYHLIDGLAIKPSLVSWSILKNVGGVGIWFSLGGVAGLVILNLDRTVAGKMVSLEAVTVLVLTGRMYTLVQGLLDQITNTARPALGQLIGQNKKAEALSVYRSMFKLSNGLAIVIGMALWAGNREFIRAWVGTKNYGGIGLDTALLFNLLVNTWILPSRAILSSALVVKPQTLSRVVEGLLNLILSVLLTWQFGLIGVALSTSLAALLTSVWYLPLLTSRLFSRPLRDFWIKDSGRLAVLTGILIPISFASHSLAACIGGFVGFFVASGLTGIIGLLVLWLAVFDTALRLRVMGMIPARIPLKKLLIPRVG